MTLSKLFYSYGGAEPSESVLVRCFIDEAEDYSVMRAATLIVTTCVTPTTVLNEFKDDFNYIREEELDITRERDRKLLNAGIWDYLMEDNGWNADVFTEYLRLRGFKADRILFETWNY